MEKFTLSITMGHDGMQDELDIIQALRVVMVQLGDMRTGARVIDGNGNKVGEWKLS